MKRWEVNVGVDVITVENYVDGEKLYVNNELQDELLGLWVSRARLWGRLSTGETVKVSIGGNFAMHCRIFVNDTLVLSK
jgi:hypothetical protein